jgi:hypothetical protein
LVFKYLNLPDVHAQMAETYREMHRQLTLIDQSWTANGGTHSPSLAEYWETWFPNLLDTMTSKAKSWLVETADALNDQWQMPESENALAPEIRAVIALYKSLAQDLEIDRNGM